MWLARAVARRTDSAGWRSQALIACIVALGLLLAGASWFAYTSSRDRESAEGWLEHAREVLDTSAEIKVATLNAMRGERGYLLTGDTSFLQPYEQAAPRLKPLTDHLERLVQDDPEQSRQTQSLSTEIETYTAWLESVIADKRAGRGDLALAKVKRGEGRQWIEAIMNSLERIEANEAELLAQRSATAQRRARANELYQYMLTALGLALLVISAFAVRSVRRATAAELALRDELRRRAMTDELTGLANRREFMASLERAISAARRNRRPLALAIVDIDHFKRVNDTYGHPAGDAVIRKIATEAVDIMRGQDTVGRLGGEEFAVVLPDCSAEDAMAACERLRLEVRESDLQIETGEQIFVTLSTGIAVFESGDTPEAMIARADRALYAAKNGGRDRVLLAA
jgi:diguanylate cyclase (GGDEF)-like protein